LFSPTVLPAACAARGIERRRDLGLMVLVVANMVEALAHGGVLRRPPGVGMGAAVRAVLAQLRGRGWGGGRGRGTAAARGRLTTPICGYPNTPIFWVRRRIAGIIRAGHGLIAGGLIAL